MMDQMQIREQMEQIYNSSQSQQFSSGDGSPVCSIKTETEIMSSQLSHEDPDNDKSSLMEPSSYQEKDSMSSPAIRMVKNTFSQYANKVVIQKSGE